METESTQLRDVIESQKMLSLPLNGRSYLDLLGLQAGVVPVTSGVVPGDRQVSGMFSNPGIINTDFALMKVIPLRESMSSKFRGEFFNIFNHANFNNPVGNFGSSQFGEVTSARDPRIGQVSFKFLW
ncbi:MAG TPA: hypothetical protein VMR62_29690 [Bryobacteraceae bacterium]|nr:hypothetical protein [Bryobacteraceae bacterium]